MRCFSVQTRLGLAVAAAAVAAHAACIEAASPKPNILFIMVDDWGHYDFGARRPANDTEIHTPNLDALATGGLMLDQAYTAEWCTPSRSALLSGRLPMHVFQNKVASVMQWNPDHPEYGGVGIPRNMTTMATFLKRAGYATHVTGKFDTGLATAMHMPEGRGFDSSLVYLDHTNSYWTYNVTDPVGQLLYPKQCDTANFWGTGWTDLWRDGRPYHDPPFGTWEDYLFGARAVEVIEQHDASAAPLFLYYASHTVHAPLQVPAEYLERFASIDDVYRRHYHAMLAALDDQIGNVTAALKRTGLWDNTLIVVSSDNGGPIYACTGSSGHASTNNTMCGGANNWPLKGGKLSPWQGGIRANSFVSGGFLPASRRGQTEKGLVHIADWLATFCSLAGIECEDDTAKAAGLPPIDSVDMWPLISGANGTSPRTEFAATPTNGQMLLDGVTGHKLIVGGSIPFGLHTGPQFPNMTTPNGGSGFNGLFQGVTDCSGGCLYNVYDDPTESHDLAGSDPTLLASMKARLAAWDKTSFNPNRGSVLPDACEAIIQTWGGFWGPWAE